MQNASNLGSEIARGKSPKTCDKFFDYTVNDTHTTSDGCASIAISRIKRIIGVALGGMPYTVCMCKYLCYMRLSGALW